MMGYGYENAAGDRISALIDMINGGGPGRSGDTFEGGGILSLLANAVAKPYGSVRERPGHTPMGAAAPTSMDVLRSEPVDAAVLPGSDTDVYVDRLTNRVERAIDRAEAAPRRLTEDEAARLAKLPESFAPPDLLSFFNNLPAGAPLSPQESMILDALLASASFNPEVQARRGLNRVSTAPLVSPRPEARPDAALTVPLPLQGPAVPAPNAALTLPPLQGPAVPAPTIAPATAYESLGEPSLFTQDQLDAMSQDMRRMAEEHNRENARLVAEDDTLKLTSAIEEAEARNVPIRVIIRGKAYTALPSGRAVAEE